MLNASRTAVAVRRLDKGQKRDSCVQREIGAGRLTFPRSKASIRRKAFINPAFACFVVGDISRVVRKQDKRVNLK